MAYQESLARKFRPAGFDQPEGSRQEYSENGDNRLSYLLGDWLDLVDLEKLLDSVNDRSNYIHSEKSNIIKAVYDALTGRLGRIEGLRQKTPEEINASVLGQSNHRNIKQAGLFLSACYNLLDTDEIAFDVAAIDGGIDYVGYRLSSGKTLTLKSDTGENTAFASAGVVVNHATSKSCGDESTGFIANFGEIKSGLSNCRLVVNYGKMGGCKSEYVTNFGSVGYYIQGDFLVNLREVKTMSPRGFGINFGETGRITRSMRIEGLAVNCGKVTGNIGGSNNAPDDNTYVDGYDGKIVIVKRPEGGIIHSRYYSTFLEKRMADHAKLEPFFDPMRQKFEAYRTASYPKCLELEGLLTGLEEDKVRLEEQIKEMGIWLL